MERQRSSESLLGETRIRLGAMWVRILTLAILLAMCGCDTKNPGLGDGTDRMTLNVVVPSDIWAPCPSTWSANWTGGTGPYSLTWDFGGGSDTNPVISENAVSPHSQDFSLIGHPAVSTFSYTVTLVDATGLTGTATGTYNIGHTRNSAPIIHQITFEDGVLSVHVSDNDNPELTVSVYAEPSFTVDQTSKVVGPPDGVEPDPCSGVDGVATFEIALNSDAGINGGSNMIEVTVDDGSGGTSSETFLINIDPFVLQPDTLYALALGSTVDVDDPLTILVATGEIAQPFHFMLGVGVVLDSDASYVDDSFNVGAIGGNTDRADGVWEDITTDGGFILGPDVLIIPGANPANSIGTSNRFDFNISPLGGVDVASVEGELFNFQVSYSAAGEKTVSFQEVNGVNRTYYSDMASGEDRFWSDFVGSTINVS